MESIETHFRIESIDGFCLGLYSNKQEFLKHCEGIKSLFDNSEFLERNKIFKLQNIDIKIKDFNIQFQSILLNRERINIDDRGNLSEISIVVNIFVEYI
jgi:hypothetical protein